MRNVVVGLRREGVLVIECGGNHLGRLLHPEIGLSWPTNSKGHSVSWLHFAGRKFTVGSTHMGCRFESKNCSSLGRYDSGGERTHGRSKRCRPGLQERKSQVASSGCINSEIAVATIRQDKVALSPGRRTLIHGRLFPSSVKCEGLCESFRENVQFQ
jgi:hypothetical protein